RLLRFLEGVKALGIRMQSLGADTEAGLEQLEQQRQQDYAEHGAGDGSSEAHGEIDRDVVELLNAKPITKSLLDKIAQHIDKGANGRGRLVDDERGKGDKLQAPE